MHAKHQHISKGCNRDLGVEHFHVGLAGLKPGAEDRLLLLSVWCTVRATLFREHLGWVGLLTEYSGTRAQPAHTCPHSSHTHMQLAIK